MYNTKLSPPDWNHWFGTDIIGDDIFLKCIDAIGTEILTIICVLPVIYVLGLCIGTFLSYFDNEKLKEFFLNLIHYWMTLPVLLIAMFLLILTGASQKNVIAILIFVLIPSQAIYVYNQLTEVKKQDFVLVKMSYGFSKSYIYIKHLLPNIMRSMNIYSLSRMPEVLMMNLGLNFLGLGVQPPKSSFGGMLFDGLAFMFSAWWMWVFAVILVTLLFVLTNYIARSVFERKGGTDINGPKY